MNEAQILKAVALEQVERNANQEWKEAALDAIEYIANLGNVQFTSDDVWTYLETYHSDLKTHQPSAMGAVFKKAAALGIIKATNRFIESERPKSHARPIRVWQAK